MQTDVAWYSDRVEFRASIRAKLLEASGLLAVLLAAGIAVQATGRSSIALPFVIFTAIAFVQQWRRLLIVCRRPVLTVWIESFQITHNAAYLHETLYSSKPRTAKVEALLAETRRRATGAWHSFTCTFAAK